MHNNHRWTTTASTRVTKCDSRQRPPHADHHWPCPCVALAKATLMLRRPPPRTPPAAASPSCFAPVLHAVRPRSRTMTKLGRHQARAERERERPDLAKGTLAAHRLHGPFPAACAIHHRSSLPCGAVLPLLMSSPMLSHRHRLVPCRGQTWSQIWRDCVGSASSTTTAMKPSPSMPPPATRRMRPPRRHPPSSHGLSPLVAAPHRIWPCDPAASRCLAPKRRPSLPKAEVSPPTSNLRSARLDLERWEL